MEANPDVVYSEDDEPWFSLLMLKELDIALTNTFKTSLLLKKKSKPIISCLIEMDVEERKRFIESLLKNANLKFEEEKCGLNNDIFENQVTDKG